MQTYTVIQTLLNRDGNLTDMRFYRGTSLVQAMSAASTVLASTETPDQEFYTVTGVRVEIEEIADESADDQVRTLVDPRNLVIGEAHHVNTLGPGSDHTESECNDSACEFYRERN